MDAKEKIFMVQYTTVGFRTINALNREEAKTIGAVLLSVRCQDVKIIEEE